MSFLGKCDGKSYFLFDNNAVVVDENTREVVQLGDAYSITASITTLDASSPADPVIEELANAAVAQLDISVLSSGDRLYTIPKSVQAEAKKALEWRKEHNRGGTPVGLNTARTLAKGGQIGIRKIRHIAKYFPRHEVDKKGKGYQPGEPNFPSNGRIAWALWGGDAARRWASAIVERDNRSKGKTASGMYEVPERYSLKSFWEGQNLPVELAPEFVIRVRLDGTGIDRLYKIEKNGEVAFWDDGAWDDLGHVEHDFMTYDKSLDDPYDDAQKTYVPIDAESALKLSALLDSCPFCSYSVAQIDSDEAQMFADEVDLMDWEMIDQVMVAAPVVNPENKKPAPKDWRKRKALGQVRNKSGQFAEDGSRIVISNDPRAKGLVKSVNPEDSTVTVQLDAGGQPVKVPANITTLEEDYKPIAQPSGPAPKIDMTGILGEPRTPVDQPNARIPGTLPPLTARSVNTLVNDFEAWAADQRLAPEAPLTQQKISLPEEKKSYNAYNDPQLRDWLDQKYTNKRGETVYPNRGWYQPSKVGLDTSLIQKKKSAKEVSKINKKDLLKPLYAREVVKASGEKESNAITPENSDVPPMYMAIVAPDDPQAVMDLVALVPESKTSAKPTTFKWKDGKWVGDAQIINDLNSPTPPPVIVLDDENLASVLEQMSAEPMTSSASQLIDEFIDAMLAAGGLDRNRGNAEKLRRYWLYGKGAAKIRWNTPGDWTRCVRQLSKYMGPRAKGYCALRHKEATGMWTGDKEHRQMYGRKFASFSSDVILPEEEIIGQSILQAMAADARRRVLMASADAPTSGASFTIPLVIPEGIESGDGRIFEKGALDMRELPLPLLWQIKTAEGHAGSVVVGQIVSMEKTDQGIGNAHGFFDTGEYGREAERLVKGGFIRGVSADLDKFEADEKPAETAENESSKKIGAGKINITKARVMAVTLVPKPAFQECKIVLDGETDGTQEETVIHDGVYVEDMDALEASALLACGMVAGSIPVTPPKSWFDSPGLKQATPLTVTDDGRVFGHIAAWNVDHIGMSYGTKPPKSRSKYSYFHTGVVRTEEGADVPVGQLTLAGGHASLEASASEAVRHYDDTASAVADVHAGEDAYGIWVAGALRPGVTPEQIRALRASAPSGDWRPIKGSLELVAVCQVNVPGFPVARARVASGQVMALVAAGAQVLAKMKSNPVADLDARIKRLESPLVAAAEEAKARVAAIKAEEVAKKFNSSLQEFADISEEVRMKLAEKGEALPDGSYPIRNASDLKNAIRAYGRSNPEDRAKVRTHIRKRARALGKEELIPENWKAASLIAEFSLKTDISEENSEHFTVDEMLQEFSSEETEFARISNRVREKLAQERKAMPDGSFPVRNISDLKNAVQAYGRAKESKRAAVRRHIVRQAKRLSRPDLVPSTWKEASEVDELVASLDARIPVLAAPVVDIKTGEPVEVTGEENRPKYTPKTQPRDTAGKFREVLARLKVDLGVSGSQAALKKIEDVENLDNAGDYANAAKAAVELLGIVDRLDKGALNKESLENVRNSAGELGKVIANLPFAFGEEAQKIRFSDMPPALRDLVDDMIKRVEDKIGKEDADIATAELKKFKSGSELFNQSEISSSLSKLLRLLT